MNYPKLAFADGIRKIQERLGSRSSYEKMEKQRYVDGLTDQEIGFLAQMDSFYMASTGDNGFPYIQHRGGPKGFIKVMDKETIGIVDFTGNRQYISAGNIEQHPKVALILVSYPLRARLKIYAEAELVELEEDENLYHFLKPRDYKFKPERMMLFKIQAYDWNCPQHITPRFTLPELEELIAPQQEYIKTLEQEISMLKAQLSSR